MADYIDQVLGPDGLLAKTLPGYESRPGQVQLAKAIDQAFCQGIHCLGEGPCGIGKSIAYGVPAIAHAMCNKKTCVIATANIALQEQLFYVDLPFMQRVLPFKFGFALLKGRNNYLCEDKLHVGAEADGSLKRLRAKPAWRAQVMALIEWSKNTQTGDKTELKPSVAQDVWRAFSSMTDDCKGMNCGYYDVCWYNKAKAIARDKQIVVTNYHMLFAHLADRRHSGVDRVLPPFEHLVMDEAHEASKIARDFMGFSLSPFVIKKLERWCKQVRRPKEGAALAAASTAFFDMAKTVLESKAYNIRLRQPGWDRGQHVRLYTQLDVCSGLADVITNSPDADFQTRKDAADALRDAHRARARLLAAVNLSDSNYVYWLEQSGRSSVALKGKPIEVADRLNRDLFQSVRSAIATSATLTTGSNFSYIRRELGVPDNASEIMVPSPFDFSKQALMVIPEGLPDVKESYFPQAVADAALATMDACEGRTLCLFTSKKNMKEVHRLAIRGKLHYKILMQDDEGELSRSELSRLFKENVGYVLFGVASFWTGIDVPGETLTGLLIDKLPFANQSDPLSNAINETKRNAFGHYTLPQAIITMRQGVGRLIRRMTDYGVVVVTDRRLVENASYGRAFLESLPPMLGTRDLTAMKGFIEEHKKKKDAPIPVATEKDAPILVVTDDEESSEWVTYLQTWATEKQVANGCTVKRDMVHALLRGIDLEAVLPRLNVPQGKLDELALMIQQAKIEAAEAGAAEAQREANDGNVG